MDVEAVRRAASEDRIRRAANFHAHDHNIRWRDIEFALLCTYRVRLDLRRDRQGNFRHPFGFIAWGPFRDRRRLRVDFNALPSANGHVLEVVTAFEVF